jgi:ribonuclease P protein component
MGKRDDRLHGPAAFRQALMTRPVSRDGIFVVYKIPSQDGSRLGFVLPKKLVRTAVHRNQIKRWSRSVFRDPSNAASLDFVLVVRVKELLSNTSWQLDGKHEIKRRLVQAIKKAIAISP